jgi:hypothetical protein
MRRSSLALAIIIAAACSGFDAPPPKRTPPPVAPLPPLSTVTAGFRVPMPLLLDLLNAQTRVQVAQLRDQPVQCEVGNCRLDLTVTRMGAITGAAKDGKIALEVPITATADLKLATGLFKGTAHVDATGVVNTETALALGHDWALHTETAGTVQLNQAQLKLGPIRIPFAELWNRNQQRISAPLFKTLDREIASNVKVRLQAERLWQNAGRPLRVANAPSAWLLLAPERVRVSPLAARNDALGLSLGVDVRAHVQVSDVEPSGVSVAAPLPPPSPLAAPSDRFAFVVPVLLPYDEAAKLAMAQAEKRAPSAAGNPVRIEELQILPSGQDVVVGARLCIRQGWDPTDLLDSCSEIFFRGAPKFDAVSRTIRIENLHYDIASEGLIMKTMRWLAGDSLQKLLQSKLIFPVGGEIDRLDAGLRNALARPQGRGVTFSGQITNFGSPGLTWTRDGFLATFPASGVVHANLDLKNSGLDRR